MSDDTDDTAKLVRERAHDYSMRLFHTREDDRDRCRWCGKPWPCPPIKSLK
jgi:hypothetical protein